MAYCLTHMIIPAPPPSYTCCSWVYKCSGYSSHEGVDSLGVKQCQDTEAVPEWRWRMVHPSLSPPSPLPTHTTSPVVH